MLVLSFSWSVGCWVNMSTIKFDSHSSGEIPIQVPWQDTMFGTNGFVSEIITINCYNCFCSCVHCLKIWVANLSQIKFSHSSPVLELAMYEVSVVSHILSNTLSYSLIVCLFVIIMPQYMDEHYKVGLHIAVQLIMTTFSLYTLDWIRLSIILTT